MVRQALSVCPSYYGVERDDTDDPYARGSDERLASNEGFMCVRPLYTNATMSETTIELRQENPDETDNMAQFESPESERVCASYVGRSVADNLGEFATLSIRDDANVQAALDKTTANYAVYETPNGVVTGLYVSRDEFDGEEPPESIGLALSESDESAFEEAEESASEAEENEAEALLAGSDDSESDDSDDEEVEISDEELDLVEN